MSAVDRAASAGLSSPPDGLPPHGYLDGVVGGMATGWCWRADQPDTRLEVELLVDGELVGSATARGRRDNLKAAGYGDGRYGFRIPLPESLADGRLHRVIVRAQGVELPPARDFLRGGPARESAAAPPAAPAEAAGSPAAPWVSTVFEPDVQSPTGTSTAGGPTPYGYFDGVVGGVATGWCWRADQPEARLDVELLVDGKVAGTATARGRRDNVARAGYGDGRYGFRIELAPEADDGATHRVAVRVQGVVLPAARDFIRGGPGPGRDQPPTAAPDMWARTIFEPAPASPPAGSAPAAATDPGPPASSPAPPRRLSRRARPPDAPELAGYIDGIKGGELFGWVLDPSRPGEAVEVEAFFDGEPVGRGPADVARPDLERAGYGLRHGFSFPLPAGLAPGRHAVEVRTADGASVPLAEDHVLLDAAAESVTGVKLQMASGSITPPPLAQPTAALLGLDGWLFEWLGASAFDQLRGSDPVGAELLEQQVFGALERHETARAAGLTLLHAVIPDKLGVYRDRLPAGVEVIDGERPVERLAAAMAERNGVDCLDLTARLRQARSHGEVFGRTARGLTWLGAFAAYRAIAKALVPALGAPDPLLRGALAFGELEPVPDGLGNLPRLVWVGDRPLPAGIAAEDEEHEGQPRLDWSVLATEYAVLPSELGSLAGSAAALLRRRSPGEGPAAVVLHDGSAQRVAPFLAEHFEQTLVLGPGADLDGVLEELRPGALIEIVAESTLLQE